MKKFKVKMEGGWNGEVDEWLIEGDDVGEVGRKLYGLLDCMDMFEEDFKLIEEKEKGYWIWENGGDDVISIWELEEEKNGIYVL